MSDLFTDKALEWDSRPIPAMISAGVGAAITASIDFRLDMTVMDFGAGTGLICSQVAPLVAKVFAVDISPAMLEKLAAKRELRDRVEVRCQDIMEQPLAAPVDVVVSAMAMHHVEDTPRLIKTFAEHLNRGGQLALADLDAEDGSFHPEDAEGVFHRGFDRTELQTLLHSGGFENVEFVTAVRIEKEDKSYPVFLLTATKA